METSLQLFSRSASKTLLGFETVCSLVTRNTSPNTKICASLHIKNERHLLQNTEHLRFWFKITSGFVFFILEYLKLGVK